MSEGREQRRLAAILAADVVGYSRLMESDEAGTLRRLRLLRREIFDPSVAAHSGRIVKLMGDGTLVEFASAVDAVTCAVEVQDRVAKHNAAQQPPETVWFRIGINVGDVIVDGDDIYGDGVNVAARLEALAEPGGIFISRSAADQVRDKVPIRIEDRGEYTVKNIVRPIQVFCVVGNGGPSIVIDAAPRTTVPTPRERSIAVLPFANMSGDMEQEYFADGISEDLITGLSKLPQLFVIARNSSFTFKGKSVNIQEVGKNLGVRYVIEGSVRKSANRVRITAQLIDATTGGHLWAERFDRELTDIFEVQDDVTQQIVGALEINLTAVDQKRMVAEQTDNIEAYDCFLRGREQWRLHTKVSNGNGRELLARAVALDPHFASAHAFLAVAHVLDYINQWGESPSRSLDEAVAVATRAVALNDHDFWAHWALGFACLYLRRHDEAISEVKRALSINPNFGEGHAILAETLTYAGMPDQALPHVEQALALNPYYSDVFLHIRAVALFHLERFEQAVDLLQQRLARNPSSDASNALLASSFGHLGQFENAAAAWAAVFRINPDYSLEYRRKILPFRNPEDFERVIDGLRKAKLI